MALQKLPCLTHQLCELEQILETIRALIIITEISDGKIHKTYFEVAIPSKGCFPQLGGALSFYVFVDFCTSLTGHPLIMDTLETVGK